MASKSSQAIHLASQPTQPSKTHTNTNTHTHILFAHAPFIYTYIQRNTHAGKIEWHYTCQNVWQFSYNPHKYLTTFEQTQLHIRQKFVILKPSRFASLIFTIIIHFVILFNLIPRFLPFLVSLSLYVYMACCQINEMSQFSGQTAFSWKINCTYCQVLNPYTKNEEEKESRKGKKSILKNPIHNR